MELESLKITLEKEITSFKEISDKYHILPELISEIPIENGVMIQDYIVTWSFIQEFKKNLFDGMPYTQFKSIIAQYSLHPKILDTIGFKIEWKGLSPVAIKKI